ncbi:phosphoribosyltransferase family protein [Sphingomonas sp. CROZ-RG-20F-R02-07]|uniref:phosphoribosyltransferase n=1 Tax=Sphingomonas sp. CROZ-RG-20F-R02-07 TaxID=2914832 RepID=UPI001F59405E|nr:phosphoribosyltransferase family protein [Sphingomonas sp. CROZ-RG-20F-R02-07]
MPVFTHVPQDEFVASVKTLAAALAADPAWTPDFLIGVGRGGLVPAVFLSHASGLPMLSVDYSSQVEEFAEAPLARLADRTRAGARLLFLDDINDSGRTIARLRAALAAGDAAPGAVRFAVLIDNRSSTEGVDYRARTIDRAVTKDWFVFPWEAVAPQAALDGDAAAVPERIA